ncbi:SAC3/GANP/Nin1/mts3/eIF-3 p25 family-domain-containing protein [Lophiotrema nucula]|uniref:SAC3/GANP/Nin1/mts3/eIF-3 p25 family-domain-containing protein n=1 Tax=Lophiotrema nucula TaxID=690887 RepID=A0A6A5Z704_9PLEO|nr:SAC3/GANP/Nin1/mts3/eIF-3 p25 family-domain-containing protein [Lophiotrema nucula]
MVKAYTRSSAGDEVELPTDKRTPLACQKSMNYMLARLDEEGLSFLYSWMWDRTRAVRKDLTSQHLSSTDDFNLYVECMERCARFHLLTLHQMAILQTGDYSRKQDIEQLVASLKSLEDRYESNRKRGVISGNESEFVAYILIISLHSKDNTEEYNLHSFRDHVRKNPRFQIACELYKAAKAIVKHKRVALSVARQNWRRFWKLIASQAVPYIMACAAEMSFGKIRQTILDAIWRSYRRPGPGGQVAPNMDWTVSELNQVLGFDNATQLKIFCKEYGFQFKSNGTEEYLDFQSPGVKVHGKGLEDLWEPYAEPGFSRSIVEAKLFNRNFSAVIKGMSVQEARRKGLITEVDPELTMNATDPEPEPDLDENSLFVPDATSANQSTVSSMNPFAQAFKPTGSLNGSIRASPFSNTPAPGLSNGASTGNPNPFKAPSSILSNGSTPGSNFFSASSSPKPSIFNTSSATPGTTTTSATPGPFTTSPATGQTVQPGLFNSSQGAIKFSPLPSANAPFPSLSHSPQAPSASDPLFLNRENQPFKQSATSFSFARSSESVPKSTAAPSFFTPPASSSTLFQDLKTTAPLAPPAAPVAPAPSGPSPEDLERRRVQEEQQQRLREEARLREQQAQREAAEQQRRQQEAQQRELERQAREQQQRAEEQRRQHERDAAYNTLAETLLWKTEQSLLEQFIMNEIGTQMVKARALIDKEEEEKKIEYMQHRKKERLSIKYIVLWRKKIYDRKLKAHARSRRKWLRENAKALQVLETEADAMTLDTPNAAPSSQGHGTSKKKKEQKPNTNGHFKKPSAPASARSTLTSAKPAKAANVPRSTPSLSHSNSSFASSSQPTTYEMKMAAARTYKNPNAPIDRTETDWFELRAMGIDPSKRRKRSLEVDSSEDDNSEGERKRSRTSSTPVPRFGPSATAAGDNIAARLQAVKASLNRSRSPVSSPNGITPTASKVRASAASELINRARAQLQQPSPSIQSVQHDFGRSVPDLTLRYSASRSNRSVATPPLGNRPAFWGRASRFVPRHLYGQGPEAVRAYFREQRGDDVNLQEPLQFSSPSPTQQSYYATQHDASMDADAEYDSGDGEDEYDSGDEDMQYGTAVGETQYEDEDDYTEEEEEEDDGYEAGAFVQDGLLDGDYYDEEYEGMEDIEQCAQKTTPGPGATQDDAIELSD